MVAERPGSAPKIMPKAVASAEQHKRYRFKEHLESG